MIRHNPEGPMLVGLTGNIATGKSQVAQMLAELGARVIDADKVAHEVMQPGGPAYDAVVQAFGREMLAADGTVNRARLGAVVFRDPEALQTLEAAVHPAVIAEVNRRIAQAEDPVVVVEAIKLIEAGMHRLYDFLWVVTASRSLQITRLVAARGLTAEEAALRVGAQPPQQEKAALADLVLSNNKDLDSLRQKVDAGWARIQELLDLRRTQAGDAIHADLPVDPAGGREVTVRPVQRDNLADAAGVAEVLNRVIAEGRHTALTGYWTPDAELAFLQSLGPRSGAFVAEVSGRIVGFQVIEPFVAYTSTMDHVAHLGTYVLAGFRGRGIGSLLAEATLGFARRSGYEKSVVYGLADNEAGLAYYRSLGFEQKGILTRQTKIDDVYHDEIFMELHFRDA